MRPARCSTSTLGLVLYECSHCGAPLDVRVPGSVVVCNYCSRSQRVATGKTGMMPTPTNWQPPPFWTPPPQYYSYVPPQPLVYHAPPKAAGCAISLVLVPVLLIAGGLAAFLAIGRSNPLSSQWDGRSTLSCDHEQIKLNGVKMKSALPKAIRAGGVCELEISDSTLMADTVIDAGGSAKIVIRDSTLVATDAAVLADVGAHVELHNVTVRVAEGQPSVDGATGLRAGAGSSIDADSLTMSFGGAKARGTAIGLEATVAGKISLSNASLSGPYKLKVDMLGEIDAKRSSLRAEVEGDSSRVRGVEIVKPAPPAPPPAASSAPPAKTPRSAPPPPPRAAPAPAPTPAPTGKKVSPCGCKPGDLDCAIKCSRR